MKRVSYDHMTSTCLHATMTMHFNIRMFGMSVFRIDEVMDTEMVKIVQTEFGENTNTKEVAFACHRERLEALPR